jgi:hypothetical protein
VLAVFDYVIKYHDLKVLVVDEIGVTNGDFTIGILCELDIENRFFLWYHMMIEDRVYLDTDYVNIMVVYWKTLRRDWHCILV